MPPHWYPPAIYNTAIHIIKAISHAYFHDPGQQIGTVIVKHLQYALGHVDHVLYSICQIEQGGLQGIISVTNFKQGSLSYQLEKKSLDHEYEI